MRDYLIRATAMNGNVRAFAVHTTQLTEELRRRHNTTPTASAALGRTAAAAAMMGAMLKGDERLTVQVQGNGPLGKIIVDANASGQISGYVEHPEVDLPLNALGKLDIAAAVGTEGLLNVVKDLGLKEPYSGSVPLISGELGEDFTAYFTSSEQTPSAVGLGVLVDVDYSIKAAGGFIVQVMPGITDEQLDELETRLAVLTPLTTMLAEGATLEQVLSSVLGEEIIATEELDVRFHCQCSRARVEQALISLGMAELQAILDEQGEAEVNCHFCNENYTFTDRDLQGVMANM